MLAEARKRHWLSDERFVVDGTLIEAWASKKSYQPKGDPPAPGQGSGRRGQLQKRDLYESKTDPEARLFKKRGGATSVLSYLGHVLSDMRHGFIAAACVTEATTKSEREAAVAMIEQLPVRHRRIRWPRTKLQRNRIRETPPGMWGNATRHTVHRPAEQRHRRSNNAAPQLCREPVSEAAHRANLRLAEGGGRTTEDCSEDATGELDLQFAAAAYNLVRMKNLLNGITPA